MDLSISLSGYNYNLPSNQSQSGSTITTVSAGPNHDYHASPANSTTVIIDDPGPPIQYLDLLPLHNRPDHRSNYSHSHSNQSPHSSNPWKQLISHDDHRHNHSHSDPLNLSPDDRNNTGCNPLMKLSRPNPALITTSIACKNELQLVDNLGPNIMDIGLISSPTSTINPRKKSNAPNHRPATVITTSSSCNGANYAPRSTHNYTSNDTCTVTDHQQYTIDVNEAPTMSTKSSIISCPIDPDSRALTTSAQICNSSNISSSDVEVVEASDHINSHIKQRQYQYNKQYYKDSATSDPMAHQLGPARKRGRYIHEHDHEAIKQQQDDDDDDGGGGGDGDGDGDELDQEQIYNASNSYGLDAAANYSYNNHSNIGDGTNSSASTILRKKLRLSREQSALLEESFKLHSTLNPKQKGVLARQLGLSPRQVEVWFQNRRARTKLKQTEADCELLKRCCETLTAENRRLRAEVAELRRRQQAQQRRNRSSAQACATAGSGPDLDQAGSEAEPAARS